MLSPLAWLGGISFFPQVFWRREEKADTLQGKAVTPSRFVTVWQKKKKKVDSRVGGSVERG